MSGFANGTDKGFDAIIFLAAVGMISIPIGALALLWFVIKHISITFH